MKRVLSILVVCIVLFTLSGIAALATTKGVPDTIPPSIWGLGISPATDPMKGCPNNVNVMVQVKASDLGGIAQVQAELRAPTAASWAGHADFNMTLQADGFWRAWIPKTFFAVPGAWVFRAEAEDWFSNAARSGTKTLTVTSCDRTKPVISNVTESADPIVASWCTGVKTVTIQARITDASGIKKADLWYMVPGGTLWQVVPMSRYLSDSYRATHRPLRQWHADVRHPRAGPVQPQCLEPGRHCDGQRLPIAGLCAERTRPLERVWLLPMVTAMLWRG